MTVKRTTQSLIETASGGGANVVVTQDFVEVCSKFKNNLETTQFLVEIVTPYHNNMVATQTLIETVSPYVPTDGLSLSGFSAEPAFGEPSLGYETLYLESDGFAASPAFGSPSLLAEEPPITEVESQMKAAFMALIPPGALWRPKESGYFDKLLGGMGDNSQESYDYINALAHIRDPRATTMLNDLEKEFGIAANVELSEATRRTALAATKYAVPNTSSWELLQDRLRAAGFDDIVVTPNDPAIDPSLITDSELIVNGAVYASQSPAYLMEANNTDIAYAGNGKAVAGYYINIRRVLQEYPIPDLSPYWRFFFFVGGEASGWPSSPSIEYYLVEAGRLEELKRLVLRYKPLRSWGVLVAGY